MEGPHHQHRHFRKGRVAQHIRHPDPETTALAGPRHSHGRQPHFQRHAFWGTGSRPTGRPALRYRDVCTGDLKAGGFDPSDLETAASDRSGWRSTIRTMIKKLRRGETADGERNIFERSSGYGWPPPRNKDKDRSQS